MATSALPDPALPALNSVGSSLGVAGVGGATAGMTVAVAGAGNGKTFPFNGGATRLLIYNGHATLAKTVTPLIAKTPGGVTVTSPTRSIPAGAIHVMRFSDDYVDPTTGLITIEAESTDIKYLAIL